MSKPSLPEKLASPRLAGVREQVGRAQMHLSEALTSSDATARFRKSIAAVYPGLAAIEIMREAATQGELTVTRDELDDQVRAWLRRHELMQAIRIHDFHRFGVVPHPGIFVGGPMRLKSSKRGTAQVRLTPSGPQVMARGNASVTLNRALQTDGNRVFDDTLSEWVFIEQAVRDYVESLSNALALFEGLYKQPESDQGG